MYYVFESEVTSFRNTIVQARLNDRSFMALNWSDGEKITEQVPELHFTASYKDIAYPDNFFTGSEYDLYSLKLISEIQLLGIDFELFSAIIKNINNEIIKTHYKNFRLLSVQDAVDLKKSILSERKIKKIILKEMYYEKPFYMFRLKNRLNIVIVHEILKQRIEDFKITGCKFTPIEEFRLGL